MSTHTDESVQLASWLKHASCALAQFDTPKLDADLLMCHVLACNRTTLYAWPEKTLTTDQLTQLNALLKRRLLGEPVAYLTEEREFWSMDFTVNKSVLVPRPETELIVELTLKALQEKNTEPVLDAGTGSGAIAIALSLQWQKDQQQTLNIIASDKSQAALNVAQNNAARLGAEQIEFVQSDWLSEFSENSIGLIVSNPPYLAADDPHLDGGPLRFEPASALVSGPDGLDAIRALIKQAIRVGKPGCKVLIEHGYAQADQVQALMQASHYSQVETHKDLNDLDRVTSGFCP